MEGCPFCNPQLDREQEVVLDNELCMFLQKPQEVLMGSGVIVPREHRPTVFELTEEEWQATYKLLKEVRTMMDKKYKPTGYNIGWNVGEAGGQEVFHAHLHVIPRYAEEPLSGKGIRYWIKQPANKIAKD